MSKKEILEKNKLIAGFLGWTENSYGTYFTRSGNARTPDELLFHSSWDWLMPAISKITRDERFIEQENREYILDIVGYGHIEDTFEAVVTFIKWYSKKYEAN